MPAALTYPGVYIEEIPSGVRTITGVATSVTAFIGCAKRGPVNEPKTINNFGDFDRIFGGLWEKSALGFAVRDFYLNGGAQAIIVRLYHAESGDSPPPSSASLTLSNLTLIAANEGAWGNHLRARVDYDVSKDIADKYGLAESDLFNLTVRDMLTGSVEEFRNLTVKESPRKIDLVLKNQSKLVLAPGILPDNPPNAHAALAPGQDLWGDNIPATNTGVADQDKASDGIDLTNDDFIVQNTENSKTGLYALEKADLFNLLCIPPFGATPDLMATLVGEAAAYCEKRRAMMIVDPPSNWTSKEDAIGNGSTTGIAAIGTKSKNAALFFPQLKQSNPLRDNQFEEFAPCGAIAGIFARTDTQRGVWKAPAGLDATLVGVPQLSVPLTDPENGELNPLAINCLRNMPAVGRVIWGSRTLQGNDRLASEWKYIPVRRTALFIEESLYRGTQWVVFEPNDEPLWAQIRLNVGAFMHSLFRQGAFQGNTPREAYFVKCDKETTTQNDIDRGIVNILVGFAPLKPAEFVVIKLQQIAGQIQT